MQIYVTDGQIETYVTGTVKLEGERVSIDVLSRICEYLNCDIGDIMSFKNENEKDGANR